MISAIAARAQNGVIGKQGALPWYLPADLKHFKQLTLGHTVIMGRKTFGSIFERLGKPLPDRENVVVTRDTSFVADGVSVVHSLEEALRPAGTASEIFVIGGADIYGQALPFTNKIYLTEIEARIDGDVYFPALGDDWHETARESHRKDDKNRYDYSFVVLERQV